MKVISAVLCLWGLLNYFASGAVIPVCPEGYSYYDYGGYSACTILSTGFDPISAAYTLPWSNNYQQAPCNNWCPSCSTPTYCCCC